jgi:ribosomal protein S18 acetylase RimI-like enzyme
MLSIFQADTLERHAQARTLFREYADQLGHDLEFQQFSQELAALPGAYTPPDGCLLLATEGDELVGCVALRRQRDRICEMKRLYVRPGWRRQGIGRRLVAAVIAAARNAGYERVRLDTLDHMEPARELYRALGFRKIAPYYNNPIPGAVFFELDLTTRPA